MPRVRDHWPSRRLLTIGGLRVLLFPEVLTISKHIFSLYKTYTILSGNKEGMSDSSGSFYPYECIVYLVL